MSIFSFKPSLLSATIAFTFSSQLMAAQTSVLDEIVVSATRTEQNSKDVAASVDIISSDKIDQTMATDPKQALQYNPAVAAQGSGRFGIANYNIRGMEDSRVKIMVDGVQQPTSYNPGATEQRFYPNSIEIDTLSAIEINKGPSSTLYGSDALGGVVLFKTKDPSDVLVTEDNENRFGIKSSYTSADQTFKNTATWAMREEKLETLLMLTYADGHETQTYGDGADVEGPDRGLADPADKTFSNILAKAFYQINAAHRVGLTVEYYQRQYDQQELSYEGYSIGSIITYSDNFNEDETDRLRVGISHNWQMGTTLADKVAWSLNYQASDALFKNYDTSTGVYGSGERMRERDAKNDSIQFDAQFDKLVATENSSHQLTYGINLIQDKFQLNNTDYKYDLGTVTPGSTGMPDATLIKWGAFIQDQMLLLDDNLILTAGLRYDSFKTTPKTNEGYETEYDANKNDAFTGKLGAVYHISDQFSTFAQISQGFKAPTVYDLYYFYNTGAQVDPNSDLEAEKSLSYELGFRGQSQSVRFEVVGFYNDYSNFITDQYLGDLDDGRQHFTRQNINKAEIYGAEFSSTVLLDQAFNAPSGLYSKLSVAYTEGRDKESGAHLDSVSPLTGNIGIGYDTANNKFGGLLNVTMSASKDDWETDDNFVAAGYTIVDLTTYYSPMQDLTLRAGLFNALDKKYWVYSDINGNVGENQDSQTQPGRNWGVSLDYQF